MSEQEKRGGPQKLRDKDWRRLRAFPAVRQDGSVLGYFDSPEQAAAALRQERERLKAARKEQP